MILFPVNFLKVLFTFLILPAKNIFRVRFQDPCPGQSHTLQANDVFHKQQWFNCIRTAIAPFQPAAGAPQPPAEGEENTPAAAGTAALQRRASVASGVTQVEVGGDAPECGSPGRVPDDTKGARAQQTRSGFRKTRDTAPFGGKRKETLV